jgi:hypothetical protein
MATDPLPMPTAPQRPRSKLSLAGDAASRSARRSLLLETLVAVRWNLTAAARELDMAGASDITRSIHDLGLTALYQMARDAGHISRQSRFQR